jgi:hypothetical protein
LTGEVWARLRPDESFLELIYWFKQLLRLENKEQLLIVAYLIVRLITQSYNLEPHWYIKFGWIEVGGKITLTPRTLTPPAGEE